MYAIHRCKAIRDQRSMAEASTVLQRCILSLSPKYTTQFHPENPGLVLALFFWVHMGLGSNVQALTRNNTRSNMSFCCRWYGRSCWLIIYGYTSLSSVRQCTMLNISTLDSWVNMKHVIVIHCAVFQSGVHVRPFFQETEFRWRWNPLAPSWCCDANWLRGSCCEACSLNQGNNADIPTAMEWDSEWLVKYSLIMFNTMILIFCHTSDVMTS